VRTGGRRSTAAQANAERIADLERQLAERDPEKIRAQVLADREAEQQREAEAQAQAQLDDTDRAEAEEYRRLRDLEDRQMTDQEYRWREWYKGKLNLVPSATKAAKAQAQAELEAERAALRQEFSGTWDTIKRQMAAAEHLPGVDPGAIVKGANFDAIRDHLYEAGQRSIQPKLDAALAENRRLKAEAQALRVSGRLGLSGTRAPVHGGRSAAHANGKPDFKTASSSDLFAAAVRQQHADG
jgi:hypothetical protein